MDGSNRRWASVLIALTATAVVAGACGSSSEDASTPTVVDKAEVAADEPAERADAGAAAPDEPADANEAEAGAEELDEATPAEASDEPVAGDPDDEPLYPDVVDATAEQGADGTWRFSVTLSSPYDSPERYADAWRVLAPDGTELGVRVLLHDHAAEQPFTRSLGDVEIPDDVAVVTIEGRDQVSGWGGATLDLPLPR